MAESERFLAIRALYVGEDFTLNTLALATDRAPSALIKAAKRYDWPCFKSKQSEGTPLWQLLKRIELLVDEKLSNGVAAKADVDEILGLLRLVEKMKALMPTEAQPNGEQVAEQQENSHEKLYSPKKIRAILRQLDERIQLLADRRAESLLSEKVKSQPISSL